MPALRPAPVPAVLSLAASPLRMRQRNEIAALGALHRHGRLSRAELARELKLNRSSSGHIIASLTHDGLVREVEEGASAAGGSRRAGRPGIKLELVPDAVFFAGVEIGVEHIAVVGIDLETRIVSSSVEPLREMAPGIEASVERAVAQAFQTIGDEHWGRCEGVGVSAPAQIDRNGFVRHAPLLGWSELYPAEIVRSALPVAVPVVAENDANAFAIGATYGRRASLSGVTLFLVLETGVGAGIVIDGVLFRGAHGLAGEIGHMIAGHDGSSRTLEQLIGLDSLMGAYRAETANGAATFEHLVRDVRDREPRAVRIAEGWARALAFGIAQACRIVDPDTIVLGGSVAALYPLVSARVALHLTQFQSAAFPLPRITVNEYAEYGSAFGAACLLHQRYLSLQSPRYADDEPGAPEGAG